MCVCGGTNPSDVMLTLSKLLTRGIAASLLFSLSVSSEDIPDQCSPSPCNPVGTVRCEDKKGDFLCHCFTGWAGARCEKGTVITSHHATEVMATAFGAACIMHVSHQHR